MRRLFASLRRHFRRERYLQIQDITNLEDLSGFILDLGGGAASFFSAAFPRPKQVVLVDISHELACEAKRKRPGLHAIVADGGRLPLADKSADMTICNSVIEHVDKPGALATEIRRASQGYFLQTPNGAFPLEPHSFIAIPFYGLIPWMWLRRLLCKVFGADFEYVNSVRYVTEQGLRSLFPDATISYERVLGLKKSFYVFRSNEDIYC
jgi:hypothetical protein